LTGNTLAGLPIFALSDKTYTLDFASYVHNMIAVVNGAAFSDAFALHTTALAGAALTASNGNLVVSLPLYVVATSGTTHTITRGLGGTYETVQKAIDSIKTAANGDAVTVQFGDGDVLNIGSESARFNNTGGTWGAVTLTGKISSAVTGTGNGTIVIESSVSVTSQADIANSGGANGMAVNHTGTATFTIVEGTITSGNTFPYETTGGTVRNGSSGNVKVTGGIVSTSGNSGSAVHNVGIGTVTVSGGTVKADIGCAISNVGTGAVIVEGTAEVTSPNNATNNIVGGTIRNSGAGTVNITAGRVSILNTTTVNGGRVIANASTGTVTVSGGIVEQTSTSSFSAADARAISNTDAGTVIISGGTVSIATTDAGAFAVESANAGSSLILGGAPTITGAIRPAEERLGVVTTADTNPFTNAAFAGGLSVPVFDPGSNNTYTLNFATAPISETIIVKNGAGFSTNFPVTNAGVTLADGNGDLVVQ
jgi:hypothetical protein